MLCRRKRGGICEKRLKESTKFSLHFPETAFIMMARSGEKWSKVYQNPTNLERGAMHTQNAGGEKP
jgi:hypothetical protein